MFVYTLTNMKLPIPAPATNICRSVIFIAARLLGAAESAARTTAPTLTDYERLEFERARTEIQVGLDGETFAKLTSEGAEMPIAEATTFALSELT